MRRYNVTIIILRRSKMQEKTKKSVALAAVAAMLTAVLILNIVLVAQMGKTNRMVETISGANSDIAQENDVLIANEYEIKSTEQISDAYKTGNAQGLSDKDRETLDMASAVLDKVINDGMSDYEKELAVYDWMTHNLQYDSGALLVVPNTQADCDNPYGVLKYHNAVCVGYATTFRLFMQMMDIECMVVHNSERYHSWNLVKLDGQWYHTDIYSDSDIGNYSHFNLDDNAQSMNENWNRDFFPAAEGYKYNYAVMNKTECESIFDVPEQLRDALDNQQGVCAFCFTEKIDEAKAQMVEEMLTDIQCRMEMSVEYSELFMSWNWISTDEGYVLCVYIYGFSSEDAPIDDVNINDEDFGKMSDAVENAFGDLEAVEYYEE